MNDQGTLASPSRFEDEVALAERGFDIIDGRIDNGRLPNDAVLKGEVSSFLDGVGGLIRLQLLEAEGKRVSEGRTQRTVNRIQSAMQGIAAWPPVAVFRVVAPLAEALSDLDLEWLAVELISLLPDFSSLNEKDRHDAVPALCRILPLQITIMLEEDLWTPEIEGFLHLLRELVDSCDDDDREDLRAMLQRVVVYHAMCGREHLAGLERRVLVADEPLPAPIARALDELQNEVEDKPAVRFALHLVIADALASGVVSERTEPRALVASAYYVLAARDEEDQELDIRTTARWARVSPRKLGDLVDELGEVLDWQPSGFDGDLEVRQAQRWQTASLPDHLLPVRWMRPSDQPSPPYTTEAALARVAELAEVAWMIIDPLEAVRFVTKAFEFGGEAPDEIDEHVFDEIIRIWKSERVVDVERATYDLGLATEAEKIDLELAGDSGSIDLAALENDLGLEWDED